MKLVVESKSGAKYTIEITPPIIRVHVGTELASFQCSDAAQTVYYLTLDGYYCGRGRNNTDAMDDNGDLQGEKGVYAATAWRKSDESTLQ